MVLGAPTTKCAHGVFKAGEDVARYCTFCNPAFAKGVSSGQGEPIELEDDLDEVWGDSLLDELPA